jgi:small conductance mechanosensitive channel
MVDIIEAARQITVMAAGKIVVAAIVLLVGVIISRLVERLVHYILKQMEVNKVLLKAGLPFALDETLSLTVKYALYFVTVVVTLNQVGLTTQIFNIVAAIVIVFVLVSMFLGVKDFIPNYWAGMYLYRKQVYKVGDRIIINNINGVVTRFTVLETTIKTDAGDMLYMPSSLLLHSQILKKH